MKLIDFYKTLNTPIIPLNSNISDILHDLNYDVSYRNVDDYFIKIFATLSIDETVVDSNIDQVGYEFLANSVLYSNVDSIRRIYEINKAVYNPIENYDRYEEMDKVTVENIIGQRNTTSINDSLTTTSTNKSVGYNSNDLVITDEQKTVNQGTHGNGKIENSVTIGQTTDINVTSGNGENGKISNHIHGNIGVTTSTTMLKEHEEFWKNYNIFNYIIKMIFDYICIPMYE